MLTRLKLFLVSRPPLALVALVLLFCSLGLLGLDGRIRFYDVKDPDVEKHWNKLLLELSNLEFCFTNSSSVKTLSDSYAADVFSQNLAASFHSDGSEDGLISQSVEQRVLLYPTDAFQPGVGYALTANMRGRHIAIKGPLALQPFNISFAIYTPQPVVKNKKGLLQPIRLHSCVTLTGSKRILPITTMRGACRDLSRPPKGARIQYSLLEWAKRSHLFTGERCDGRVRLHTDFNISPHLLPHLNQNAIAVISFRLRIIVLALISILIALLGFGAYFIDPSDVARRNRFRTISSFKSVVSEL